MSNPKFHNEPKSENDNSISKCRDVVAGLHLSGANARKSAVVLLQLHRPSEDHAALNISLLSVYEKIGSSGSLFSDDRILNILSGASRIVEAIVDCPLTEPPCVSCVRPVCPGAVRCEDVSVAMMLSHESQRGRKGAHKLRPVNPQQQRLWDIMYARHGAFGNLEPSYSANMAPLVVRARTLARRLKSELPDLSLRETNIAILVAQLAQLFDGKELFNAFLASCMGVWRVQGLSRSPSEFFAQTSGWVEVIEPESLKSPFEIGQ
ncbi:MAG: hypothetical protein NT027_04445 [Proteobacteria bacterium]|nr:hypothetical protein [Pseudomonadota bacterium]